MDEVDLAEVWLGGIDSYARAMFDGFSTVRVVLYAQAGEQLNRLLPLLAEGVGRGARY